jgi:hypothetical protein
MEVDGDDLRVYYCPSIYPEGLRNTTKSSIRRDGLWAEVWNRKFPKYEAGVLIALLRCSVARVYFLPVLS